MNRVQEPEARTLIADLRLPAGSTGLDVGCGVGLYAQWLAESVGPKGSVIGLEPTAERVDAARELLGAGSRAANVEFRQGDATALEIETGAVDWLWCGDVLHHVLDTAAAVREFCRVVRPGGRIIVKESQVLSAMFLPGFPELERRIQLAEIERTREEGGGRSFQERRQLTLSSLRAAGLAVSMRNYLIERRAPLAAVDREYIQHTVFRRNWGERLRERLSAEDWELRSALCDPGSPRNLLDDPAYYCLYPITVFSADLPLSSG
jgi:demethylmenaquinone methyltransferase/2-methoxy-6-polyprenyl-1,4-benzoquinol methylase